MNIPREHYLRRDVQREILDFCRGRWAALHCVNSSGNLVFKRYINGKPMKIETAEDLVRLSHYMFKSIYATANVYRRIQRSEDLYEWGNIAYCTPTWDIDSELKSWKETIRVAKEILRFLAEWGVKESVYVKWSGNGCHIHINERSISEGLLEKYNPLDLAYAIVEYVNTRLSLKFIEISSDGKIKVENKMDPARVFTCPLSLHRELDVVCICMKPHELEYFTPDWINPQKFKHNADWRQFRDEETDRFAEAAYKAVGGYPLKPKRRRRKTKSLDEQIIEWLWRD